MVVYIVVLFLVIAIPIAIWIATIYLSFRSRRRGARQKMAAVSVLFTLLGALGVCSYSVIEDFNDYPGYACLTRDSPKLNELRDSWYPSPDDSAAQPVSDLVSSFEYELFPVGMKCAHWAPGSPEQAVVTHSHWIYTPLFHGLMIIAVLQGVRVLRPEMGSKRMHGSC